MAYTTNYAINAPVDVEPYDDMVIGDIRMNDRYLGSDEVEACLFGHIEIGDTLHALGYRSGGSRKVIATRMIGSNNYVLVEDGWYRWTQSNCVHVS